MKNQRRAVLLGLILVFVLASCGKHPAPEPKAESAGETETVQETPLKGRSTKPYQELLKDPHMVIRLASARVLLVYGDRSGEGALIEALESEDTRNRIDAFLALSSSPTLELIPILEKAVNSEENPLAEYVMKRSLKEIKKHLSRKEE